MTPDVLELDATGVLSAMEGLVDRQWQGEVDMLRLALQWADLHGDAPGGPRVPGGDHLMLFGGEGTPLVRELVWAELAVVMRRSDIAVRHLGADALDLRHRLPLTFQAVQDLRLPVWVARKVAAMSRGLDKDVVRLVDVAVAAAADQAPGRVIAIAEAKVIEADPDAHRARLAADAAKVGVRHSHAKPGSTIDAADGEPATQRVTLKLPKGAALGFGAAVDELADAIHNQLPADERDTVTRGELEVMAVELISNPHAATAFLDSTNDAAPSEAEPARLPKRPKTPATLYVHVSDLTLTGVVDGVARVEGMGPMLLEQLAELLQHREIQLQPVIDLNQSAAVSGYEHPALVKHRTLLRMLGDAFPHSATMGYRRLDIDHPTPYLPPSRGGPPDQTGDHNAAPLTRTHHRIKTHVPGYQVRQLALGAYRWVTPHGLARVVTPSGTRKVELLRDAEGRVIGEIYSGPSIEFHPRE